jgi:monoamine oxidase
VSAALERDLATIRNGLPARDGKRHRVVVVGAGMSGLVAAYELARAGHDPLLLEARQRVGGRVYTMREPFAPGLYAEAGAMRIPLAHKLTLACIERFGLNVKPFTTHNPKAYCHLFGKRLRLCEFETNPDLLGGELAEHDRGLTSGARWEALLTPFAQRIEKDGDAAWSAIVAQYDGYSTREFLEEQGWSEAAIELFGLVCNQEALMNACFLELLREEVGRYYTDMVRIDGGADQLPNAYLPALRDRIRFGARMIALDQSETGVTVHYQTAAGRAHLQGDYAIVTIPYPVLRHVEVLQPFSHAKRRAIRQLRYDASAKIFFQCRRRFWEDDDGIHGGGTVTDLPIRNVYYPTRAARPAAACCSRATPGPRTRSVGARCRPTSASRRRSRTSPRSTRRSSTASRSARRGCGTTTRTPAARSRCSSPRSRASCTSTSSRPRGACTSPASTPRSRTPGSRARSSRGCARRARSTTHPN